MINSRQNMNAPARLFRDRAIKTMELKLRTDLHLARKLWHVLGIVVMAMLIDRIPVRDSLFYLSLAAIIVIPFDILRLKRSDLNHRIVRFFRWIIRIEEVATLSGTSFLIVGTFLVVLLFPKNIATLSILFLAFGDPASSIIGVLYGKDKIWGRKSLQGALACFLVCSAVSAVYFFTHNLMIERLVLVSILGGIIGSLSEIIQIKRLDDNMTFPVFAAFGLWCLFALFGGFT
jgi:diacylglycerol kinase (CTP)